MSQLFYRLLLPLTLMGSAATVLLIGLQAIFSRMGKRFSGLPAWGVAAAFFLLPVSPLFTIAFGRPFAPLKANTPVIFHAAPVPSQTLADGALKFATLSPAGKLLPLVPILWLAGFLVSLFLLAVRLRRFSRYIESHRETLKSGERQALFRKICDELQLKKQIQVFELPEIQSPFAYGLFHPAIYLPQAPLPEWAEKLAIRHELLHIGYAHLWIKAATEGTLLLHWFNPLAFILKRKINAACEIDCDFLVTKGMNPDERKAYGALLLKLAEPIRMDAVYALSQKGRQLSVRLLALRKTLPNKQQKVFAVLLAALLLLPCIPASALCESTMQSTAQGATLLSSALAHAEDFLPSGESKVGQLSAPEGVMDLLWPVPDFRYCSRVQDSGISIVAASQTEIKAAADGVVLATTDSNAEINPSYGQTVILVHGSSPDIATCYTHCETLYVQPGDTVRAGQVIATVGNSGDVSGSMCRYQVSIDGYLYNPARWYSDFSLGENLLS